MLGPGLLATLGDHHKRQRKFLNPLFSTTQMKDMLPMFWQVSAAVSDSRIFVNRSSLKSAFVAAEGCGQTARQRPTQRDRRSLLARQGCTRVSRTGRFWIFARLVERR